MVYANEVTHDRNPDSATERRFWIRTGQARKTNHMVRGIQL